MTLQLDETSWFTLYEHLSLNPSIIVVPPAKKNIAHHFFSDTRIAFYNWVIKIFVNSFWLKSYKWWLEQYLSTSKSLISYQNWSSIRKYIACLFSIISFCIFISLFKILFCNISKHFFHFLYCRLKNWRFKLLQLIKLV